MSKTNVVNDNLPRISKPKEWIQISVQPDETNVAHFYAMRVHARWYVILKKSVFSCVIASILRLLPD